jgi:hypothetical protein
MRRNEPLDPIDSLASLRLLGVSCRRRRRHGHRRRGGRSLRRCQDVTVLADAEIVVAVRLDRAVAAVRRTADGLLWLSYWRDEQATRVAGTRLDDDEPAIINGEGCVAVGGRAPKTVSRALVKTADGAWHVAATSAEAWVACVPADEPQHATPPVVFFDAAGDLVPRVAANIRARGRELSRDEWLPLGPSLGFAESGACPVCGATAWHYVVGDSGTGGLVFCGVCGHNGGGSTSFFPSPS